MFEILFSLMVFASPPLLAIVVLVIRLRAAARQGGVPARIGAALRNSVRRPVWLGLIAASLIAALLTFGLERLYLANAADSSRWGFDVVLLTMVLGQFAGIVCAAFVGLTSAIVSRARGFGAGTVAGFLSIFAIAVGTASAHVPLRIAYLADPSSFPIVANLGDGDLLVPFDGFFAALIWAVPWPILGAALVARTADRPHATHDVWQLVLDVATADLPQHRAAWGEALRAELASIEPSAERRKFALGGAWAAVRSGLPQGAWLLATGVAVVVAGGSFAASRWSLAHSHGGILGFWVSVPSMLVAAVAFVAAWQTKSFSSALRAGALAGLAALIAVITVGIPEAILWANQKAGYLSTGDAVPPTVQAAVLDVLRPEFLIAMILVWTMGAASGAALGVALRRSPRDASAA